MSLFLVATQALQPYPWIAAFLKFEQLALSCARTLSLLVSEGRHVIARERHYHRLLMYRRCRC